MTRPRAWIADWLRTWRDLGDGSPAAAQQLAALFALDQVKSPVAVSSDAHTNVRVTPPIEPKPEPAREPRPIDTPTPQLPSRTVVIEKLERRAVVPVAAGPSDALPPPAVELPRHELKPLFRRAITRNLLSAAAATWRAEGPIAIKTLVDDIARGKPIRTLPRRPIPTVRVGAVLLVSKGIVEPFAADVRDLRQQLRRVAGTASVAEWWLTDDMRRTQRQPNLPPWPPAPQTPVIAVVATLDRLDVLAAELARTSCPLIAVIPGKGVATPARNLTVIGWDHRTRVSDVVRAKRQADRR